VIWQDVRPRLHREHGEGLAHLRRFAPNAGNAEDRLILLCEQPLVLALLLRILGLGELVKAIGDDQATVGIELSALRPEILDRSLVRTRPAPAPLHELTRGSKEAEASKAQGSGGGSDIRFRSMTPCRWNARSARMSALSSSLARTASWRTPTLSVRSTSRRRMASRANDPFVSVDDMWRRSGVL
jgi:hypothetical protein